MDRTGDHGRRLSDEERLEMQRRVGAGETFAGVAAAVGCSTKSIQRLFVRTGGLAPRTPVRSPLRLSLAEREEISRGLGAGDSSRAIARRLGRAPSTVSREIAPTGGRTGYRAWRAERRAIRQARRPKAAKLACYPRLRAEVERWLAQRWSPQQIAHRLTLDHPYDRAMHVSHETIYRSLFVQARGALRQELTACLRTGRDPRSPWQRPTNENTNGLLRQYLPRTADLAACTQRELDAIARELNGRPRQTLGWMKPYEVLPRLLRRPLETAASYDEHVECPVA